MKKHGKIIRDLNDQARVKDKTISDLRQRIADLELALEKAWEEVDTLKMNAKKV